MTLSNASPLRIAYLNSQYPTLSMIFVIREVVQLRAMGFDIGTISINSPDRPFEKMTALESEEARNTFYIKPQGFIGALKATFRQLRRRPLKLIKSFCNAFRMAGFDLSAQLFNLFYFVEAVMVVDWMDANNHNHLHAHLGSQAATVGLIAKSISGCGYSITVHGPDEFYDVYRQFLTEKIDAADFIVCISSFARSQLMKLSPYTNWSKFDLARLGVDTNVFKRFNPPERRGAFEILCIGRLTPAKGQHILIDAIKQLKSDGKNVVLRLVGSGVDESSLKHHVTQSDLTDIVIFEGAVNQDYILDMYRSADAFCIPSFAEGIPVVLMEAMAMELPCVTTRITGIPELIDDGIDGLLVAASDVDGLTNALVRLIDNPDLARQIGFRAREKIALNYNLSLNVELLSQVFLQRFTMLKCSNDPLPH